MNYFQELSKGRQNESNSPNDDVFESTLKITDPIYIGYFYKRMLFDQENFFETTCLSANLYEKILDMCSNFRCNPKIQLQIIHYVDRFYKIHHAKSRDEYAELCRCDPNYSRTYSWSDVLKRIKRQMSLRVVTCIYVIMKYELRLHQPTVEDCLIVLAKYGYFVSAKKFNKSQMRVIRDTGYNFQTFTLLDCVTTLQTLLKYNLRNLNLEFHFPHIYSLIYLIYACELKINDNELESNHPRSFLIYACLVIDLIAVLINHSNTREIFDELINITSPKDESKEKKPTHSIVVTPEKLLNLRLKYLNLILNQKINLKW